MSKHTFGSAVRWNFVGSAARVLITLMCQITLLRILGPVVAGQFALFLVVVGVGTILSEGGMMVALTRAPNLDDKTIGNATFLILCYSSVIVLILIAANGLFLRLFQLPNTDRFIPLIATLNVLPLGLSSVPLSLLRRQYRSRDVQMIQLGAYVLGFVVFALPLAFFFPSAWVMVVGFTLQSFATLIAGVALSGCSISPRITGALAMQRVSGRALLVNIAYFLNESSANVLTAHFLGTRATGLYGTAFNLLRMPTDVIITTFHAPLLVSTAQDNSSNATRSRFLSSLDVLATTVFPAFVVVFLCGAQIIRPILGSKWIEAGPVLSVVALIMVARLLSQLSGALVWGHGRLMLDLGAQVLALGVTLGSFMIFVPSSATQVAWIVLLSIVLRMLVQGGIAMRSSAISLSMMLSALIWPSLITIGTMLPMYWIGRAVKPDQGILSFLIFCSAAALLLMIRVGLGVLLSPYAWASIARDRLFLRRR